MSDDTRGALLEGEPVEGNLVAFAPSAVEALNRSEIDVQIATAKRYPRSLEAFQRRAMAMATIDEETAESCLYRRPVGKKRGGGTEYAEGMSVRMAEIVGSCYCNLRVYAQLIEQPDEYVKARGMAWDLETNVAISSEVIESTLKADGKPYSDRMRIVVAKAALSKARRDATFQVVPRALAKPIETAIRKILLGTAETLEKRRQKVTAWISKLGIEERRVYAALGIGGPADLTAEKLELLTGVKTAIRDGETTIDEAFPPDGSLGAPQPAQRKSQQQQPDPPAPVTAEPSPQPPAPATPHIGVIVKVDQLPNGTLITLDTGFRAATKDESIIRGAGLARDQKFRIELIVKPPRDPKYAPVVTEIRPVEVSG